MNQKIEIYTKPLCAYCQRAKELLRIKGVEFTEHDITLEPHRAAEFQRAEKGFSIPSIFINDVLVGSCTELFDLDENGALDSLLWPAASDHSSMTL